MRRSARTTLFDNVAFCSYSLTEVITWDDSKRQANLRDHNLDFEGCVAASFT